LNQEQQSQESGSPQLRGRAAPPLDFMAWMSLICIIALVLRVFQLGIRSFWLDEAASSMLARVDWRIFASALTHRQANMAFYYLLLRGWIHLGNSESWIRMLSVITGVAAVPLLYGVGALVVGQKAARIAAFLIAINAFHIAYSQEGRGYSLVVFLALVSCYFFLKSVSSGTPRSRIAYLISSVLLVYSQIFAALVLPAQWVSLPWRWKSGARKRMLVAAGSIVLLASPLVVSLGLISDRSQLQWMNQSSVSSLRQLWLDFSGNAGNALLILDVALMAGSALLYVRERKQRPASPHLGYVLLWLWLVIPTFLVAAVSVQRPIFQARYLIACLPAFLLLVADGLARIRRRIVFASALMAVTALSLVGVYSYFRSRADLSRSDDWRDASRYILSQAYTGDAVLFPYSAEEIAFREYWNRSARKLPEITQVPARTDLELLSTAGVWTPTELASKTASQYSRVWLITALRPNEHSQAILAAVQSHGKKPVAHRNFGFVSAELFADENVGGRENLYGAAPSRALDGASVLAREFRRPMRRPIPARQ
jgi:uncharacterized membrane protein